MEFNQINDQNTKHYYLLKHAEESTDTASKCHDNKQNNWEQKTKPCKATISGSSSSESMGYIIRVHEVVGLRNTATIYQWALAHY